MPPKIKTNPVRDAFSLLLITEKEYDDLKILRLNFYGKKPEELIARLHILYYKLVGRKRELQDCIREVIQAGKDRNTRYKLIIKDMDKTVTELRQQRDAFIFDLRFKGGEYSVNNGLTKSAVYDISKKLERKHLVIENMRDLHLELIEKNKNRKLQLETRIGVMTTLIHMIADSTGINNNKKKK